MASYTSPLRDVLDRIYEITPVNFVDTEDDGEWIHLISDDLSVCELYQKLSNRPGSSTMYTSSR